MEIDGGPINVTSIRALGRDTTGTANDYFSGLKAFVGTT
jgi:hypothetical protein